MWLVHGPFDGRIFRVPNLRYSVFWNLTKAVAHHCGNMSKTHSQVTNLHGLQLDTGWIQNHHEWTSQWLLPTFHRSYYRRHGCLQGTRIVQHWMSQMHLTVHRLFRLQRSHFGPTQHVPEPVDNRLDPKSLLRCLMQIQSPRKSQGIAHRDTMYLEQCNFARHMIPIRLL